ncbi:hypothetical protein OM076_43290 [Solirubrobacter ginsenosidimutans]|uniref:Uncharacterized protein n=1 Tax=Solirubrobacter ginsenosidimutans TaxID=490573 RepID=A0A9X3N284_9ACTN|nr:hypothetical protein [Solirubrobacter ginsenosidimutans]MDA0167164.1 hypothetical protein [Solirubrobacter ginsenosidimutans]
MPASAHAADLFPVDDWLGSGIKKAGEVALGPLKVGAEEIARLLATIVGALADLLIPKSLVRAGIDGIRWLVELPTVGNEVSATGAVGAVRMPHLAELRGVLTWIGITLLPLGVVISAGRAFLMPGVDTDSPAEILQRAFTAGFGLLTYDWAWGVLTRLSRLLTDALLGLPWVADGVERMLETLLIGGAAGTAVASEFVIPLLIACAGAALLGLLAIRVGLEVVTALVYVLGGLALGASVTPFGRRLLSAWMLAAGAILLLPLLWTAVFVTGAALMLDAQPAGGSGFVGFVAQLYNVVAALAVFALAIMLAKGVFRQALGAINSVALTPTSVRPAGLQRGAAAERTRGLTTNATPAGLARFSQQLRGGSQRAAVAGTTAATSAVRHPLTMLRGAGAATRRQVQTTRTGADALRLAMSRPGLAALGDVARTRTAGSLRTRTNGNGRGAPLGRQAPGVRAPTPQRAPARASAAGAHPMASSSEPARRASPPEPARHARPPVGVEQGTRFAVERDWLERSRNARSAPEEGGSNGRR